MKHDELGTRMRRMEFFHHLRVPDENWTVIRVDGRSFSKFTAEHYDKPFDEKFHRAMVHTTLRLMEEFQGVYGYTESDEISIFLGKDWDFFDRELEKLISLSAAVASSAFSLATGFEAQFDSRVWIAGDFNSVVDYFRWRQSDAARCALNGWCYWTSRQEGLSAKKATERLHGMGPDRKNELLFQSGVNFNEVPAWQRRGVGAYWESFEKEGFNPKTGQTTTAVRRRLTVDEELPMKAAFAEFLQSRFGPPL